MGSPRRAALLQARHAAIAKPFSDTEGEKQATEGETHQSDDEREPAGVGACACGRKAAKNREKQYACRKAGRHDGTAPAQELARAVVMRDVFLLVLSCRHRSALTLRQAKHDVCDDSRDRDVKPDGKGPARDLAVLRNAP
jgi:hypothetical protein